MGSALQLVTVPVPPAVVALMLVVAVVDLGGCCWRLVGLVGCWKGEARRFGRGFRFVAASRSPRQCGWGLGGCGGCLTAPYGVPHDASYNL